MTTSSFQKLNFHFSKGNWAVAIWPRGFSRVFDARSFDVSKANQALITGQSDS